MNPISAAAVATSFTVGGWVLGLPSIAVLAFYGLHTLNQRLAAPTTPTDFGDNPDAVLRILQGMTQAIGAAAHLVGSLAQMVLDVAALAAGAGLVLAIGCWLTGRGLQADALWARIGASAVLALVVLIALVAVLSLRSTGRLVPLLIAVVGLLATHAVWLGPRPAGA